MKKSLAYGTATTLLVTMATSACYAKTAYAVRGRYGPDVVLEQAYGTDVITRPVLGVEESSLVIAITIAEGVALTVAGAEVVRQTQLSHDGDGEKGIPMSSAGMSKETGQGMEPRHLGMTDNEGENTGIRTSGSESPSTGDSKCEPVAMQSPVGLNAFIIRSSKVVARMCKWMVGAMSLLLLLHLIIPSEYILGRSNGLEESEEFAFYPTSAHNDALYLIFLTICMLIYAIYQLRLSNDIIRSFEHAGTLDDKDIMWRIMWRNRLAMILMGVFLLDLDTVFIINLMFGGSPSSSDHFRVLFYLTVLFYLAILVIVTIPIAAIRQRMDETADDCSTTTPTTTFSVPKLIRTIIRYLPLRLIGAIILVAILVAIIDLFI